MAEAPAAASLPPFALADLAGRFGQALHRAGVPVPPERCVRFLDALRLVPPVDLEALYWVARLAFVTGGEQIAPFDRVFAATFGGTADPATGRGDPHVPPLPGDEPAPGRAPDPGRAGRPAATPLPAGTPGAAGATAGDGDRERDAAALPAAGSPHEALTHRDLGGLDAEERAALRRLLASLTVRTPLRRTRRTEVRRRGRHVDLRRTLRRSQRTGGEPIRLARSRNRVRPRRLVLVCDISGSMAPYTHAYLRFFQRAAAGVSAEAFVFATRLTRLTRVLRDASPEAALRRAGGTAPDWSGGTRIGHALAELNDRFGRRGMARGAVVVIFSDGWEGEDPAAVAREMRRLALVAHRIVWVNPRKAAPGYAPRTGGMAAALPHCDAFVSGHSFAALAEVVEAIGEAG